MRESHVGVMVGSIIWKEPENLRESGSEVTCCCGDRTTPFGPKGGSMSNDPCLQKLELDVGKGGNVRGGGDPVGTSCCSRW